MEEVLINPELINPQISHDPVQPTSHNNLHMNQILAYKQSRNVRLTMVAVLYCLFMTISIYYSISQFNGFYTSILGIYAIKTVLTMKSIHESFRQKFILSIGVSCISTGFVIVIPVLCMFIPWAENYSYVMLSIHFIQPIILVWAIMGRAQYIRRMLIKSPEFHILYAILYVVVIPFAIMLIATIAQILRMSGIYDDTVLAIGAIVSFVICLYNLVINLWVKPFWYKAWRVIRLIGCIVYVGISPIIIIFYGTDSVEMFVYFSIIAVSIIKIIFNILADDIIVYIYILSITVFKPVITDSSLSGESFV